MKSLTRKQLESHKEKAVRFVRDVLGDPDRAGEIADEPVEDYAERRKIQIVEKPRGGNMATIRAHNPGRPVVNPQRPLINPRGQMRQANPQSRESELQARIQDLEDENGKLQDTLDDIANLAGCDDPNCQEGEDQLIVKLNSILDIAAPGDVDEDEGDDSGE